MDKRVEGITLIICLFEKIRAAYRLKNIPVGGFFIVWEIII